MWLLRKFTDRIKIVTVKGDDGKDNTITTERQIEKVCAHTKLEQIVGTFFKCIEDPTCDKWFEINYKVMLSTDELMGLCEKLCKHEAVSFVREQDLDMAEKAHSEGYDAGLEDGKQSKANKPKEDDRE